MVSVLRGVGAMNIGRYFKMNTQYRSLCDVNDLRPSLATQIRSKTEARLQAVNDWLDSNSSTSNDLSQSTSSNKINETHLLKERLIERLKTDAQVCERLERSGYTGKIIEGWEINDQGHRVEVGNASNSKKSQFEVTQWTKG